MIGAILIVSGPTVVTPILDFAKPNARVRGILIWEGTILDPMGALFAVVVFQIVKASSATSLADGIVMFFEGILVAVIAAVLGIVVMLGGAFLAKGNRLLETQVLLGGVIVAAGLANAVADDSGLLTALLLGILVPRIAKRMDASLDPAMPFFNTIVSVGIGVLFISISALVPSSTVAEVALPAVLMAVLLIVVVRPFVAWVCTLRAGLPRSHRAFIGVMDPRGIVAAATASSVGASLVALKITGAQDILPVAFIIIAVTVTFYGLSAVPLAGVLKVRD